MSEPRARRQARGDERRFEADQAEAFLLGAFEGGDAAGIADALGTVVRARGAGALAAEAGVTRQALYKALSRGGNPEFATIVKVVRALGYRLTLEPLEKA